MGRSTLAPTRRARPTTYKGIQMRSRLEAGFAQWLDRVGCDWEYEPECFADETGQYLPDFLIRDVQLLNPPLTYDVYVEVKPTATATDCVDLLLGPMSRIPTRGDYSGEPLPPFLGKCPWPALMVASERLPSRFILRTGDRIDVATPIVTRRDLVLAWTDDVGRHPWQGEWWKGDA